jgi:DNA-binding MarR family transcriptional regulator
MSEARGMLAVPNSLAESERNLLSTHGMVLFCLASQRPPRVRDVARSLHLTERTVQRVIGDLAGRGYVSRHRVGRRTFYLINPQAMFHPAVPHPTVGEFLTRIEACVDGAEADVDQAV